MRKLLEKKLEKIIESLNELEPQITNFKDNLSTEERRALSELKNNNEIIIKKADKGGSIVIMDSSYYRDHLVLEGHFTSNTYQQIEDDCDVKVMKQLKKHVKNHEICLTDKEIDYLTKFDWKTSNFYVLPKIHKCTSIKSELKSSQNEFIEVYSPHDLKGRPIVAGCEAPTQRLSALIEKILSPIAKKSKHMLKTTGIFLDLYRGILATKKPFYTVLTSATFTRALITI